MFDHSNCGKTCNVLPKTWKMTRWKEGKPFKAEYKNVEASCWMPLLTKKNIKGRHAKIDLDTPVELRKNVFWSDVTQLELSGPMNQRYVWSKKGKANEQKNTISMVKHGGEPVLLWGLLLLGYSWLLVEIMNVWRTSWILWSIKPFWQELWCLWCKDWRWWSMDFPAGQSSQSIHPNLIMLGSGIGLLSLQM